MADLNNLVGFRLRTMDCLGIRYLLLKAQIQRVSCCEPMFARLEIGATQLSLSEGRLCTTIALDAWPSQILTESF